MAIESKDHPGGQLYLINQGQTLPEFQVNKDISDPERY